MAKNRGLAWDLSDSQALSMYRETCHYCGVPPNPLNGIDRKDNSQGYNMENCVPCCAKCNYAKRTMTYADFFAWIDRIVEYRGKK